MCASKTAFQLPSRKAYRPDIDGLRAFAVLLVILNHFHIAPFSGGYVGVDIFFVISGYLITSIIFPQIQQGTFNFKDFYERRCRRLLPPLYLMLLCVALMPAFMLFFPFPTEMYQSLRATLFFGANIFFRKHEGYFDAASEEKPLIHMWSLSVEEQFYLLFPLFLLVLYKYRKKLIPHAIGVVFFASLGFSAASLYSDPAISFYWLPSRAWELSIGCLLGYFASQSSKESNPSARQHTLSLFVLALLLFPAILYDSNTPFPAFMALAPCLGAALFLYLGRYYPQSWLIRAFCLPPVVFVGLISYGLYLWHWPIWVLMQHLLVLPSSSQTGPTLIFLEMGKAIPYTFSRFPILKSCAEYPILVASLLTAFCTLVSYFAIERPIRNKQIFKKSASFYIILVLFTLVLGSLSWWGQNGTGLSLPRGWQISQGNAEVLQGHAGSINYLVGHKDRASTNVRSIEPLAFAAMGMPQLNIASTDTDFPVFAALGDSHYAMFAPLMANFFTVNNIHGQHSALIALSGAWPAQILCQGGVCATEKDGKSLYTDDSHLSTYGVQVVKEAFELLFTDLLRQKKKSLKYPLGQHLAQFHNINGLGDVGLHSGL